jgi:hypothetical protein
VPRAPFPRNGERIAHRVVEIAMMPLIGSLISSISEG